MPYRDYFKMRADTPFIEITAEAREHFESLLKKEPIQGTGLRIFVERPGTASADVVISFCPPGEHRGGDIPLCYDNFTVFVEKNSEAFLREAKIDYKKDPLSAQLAITAPHLRDDRLQNSGSLEDRIEYLLEAEINPGLAGHGGRVSLVKITPQNEVVLQFGGGCHGCGMVDVTLKNGIEKTIRAQIPEVTAVIDATDHSQGENPYYA